MAQTGDAWYQPFGIWVSSDGQANPYMTVDPITGGSPHLVSFWQCVPGTATDHAFVRYNGRYYDGSYDHPAGASHATINEKADAGISHYYYGGKLLFNGTDFVDDKPTLPLERIWLGPFGWMRWSIGGGITVDEMNLLRVANDPAQSEMEE